MIAFSKGWFLRYEPHQIDLTDKIQTYNHLPAADCKSLEYHFGLFRPNHVHHGIPVRKMALVCDNAYLSGIIQVTIQGIVLIQCYGLPATVRDVAVIIGAVIQVLRLHLQVVILPVLLKFPVLPLYESQFRARI